MNYNNTLYWPLRPKYSVDISYISARWKANISTQLPIKKNIKKMKFSIIFALAGIVIGNSRLRNFRRYQKAAKNARKVPSRGRPAPAGRGQVQSTLSRVCTPTTCGKCEKIVLNGGRKEFCSILLNLKNCCSFNNLARRRF